MLESAAAQVHQHAVEGFALAFVDGDRPGQPQGVLPERADALRFDLAGGAGLVAQDFPVHGRYVDPPFFAFRLLHFHHHAGGPPHERGCVSFDHFPGFTRRHGRKRMRKS